MVNEVDRLKLSELVVSGRRWVPSEGELVVSKWRSSGWSMKRFCRETGVQMHRLAYWRDRLSALQEQSVSLVRVEVSPPLAPVAEFAESGVRLEFEGVVVRVSREFCATTLSRALEVLRSC